MNEILTYLRRAVEEGASDVFIVSGVPVSFKHHGVLCPAGEGVVMPDSANRLIGLLYELAGRSPERFFDTGDDDFSLSIQGLSRFRVSAYRQRGSLAAVIRVVAFEIPHYAEMSIPKEVADIADKKHGLVVVAGPAGGGKTTTLACIVEEINRRYPYHVITIEDPIEYLYHNKQSVISQREVESDTKSFLTGLRACLRQAPDVILLGEMRDYETIRTAVTAAETGGLVLTTLHTLGVVNTIDRIIDVFPPEQHQQIRVQLSMVLQTVVSEQLLPSVDGRLLPCFEIMHLNGAIRNMIREARTHQIAQIIQSSSSEGMVTMDESIVRRYRKGEISAETALKYAANVDAVERRVSAKA